MTVGIVVEKQQVDTLVGELARDLNRVMERIGEAFDFLSTLDEAAFVALGFTAEDYALVVSWYNDTRQLQQVYLGAAAQPNAVDFRTWARRLWGTGV